MNEKMAIFGAALVAAPLVIEQMLDRIPPLAKKAVVAVRSIRAVVDEVRKKRE
ncbi:hypothetical protein [Streptomyces nitrosporeus]|uniref:hypothetical protein n=1 Tax=Streptomyces nitrosporeus TaxID=28894 RepID=UPI0033244715